MYIFVQKDLEWFWRNTPSVRRIGLETLPQADDLYGGEVQRLHSWLRKLEEGTDKAAPQLWLGEAFQ